MTEEPLDESKYGKLIWPKFYGQNNYAKRMMPVGYTLPLIPICFGIIMMFFPKDLDKILGSIILAGGIIALFIFFIRIRNVKHRHPVFWKMLRNNELEWDLYENGILAKAYSETGPNNIEERFIGYSELANVYVNVKKERVPFIFEMIQKNSSEEDRSQDKIILNDRVKNTIMNIIWFIRNDGKLHSMDKVNFRKSSDVKKFEQVLRQKVKSVE
jgi:hypothetical protein